MACPAEALREGGFDVDKSGRVLGCTETSAFAKASAVAKAMADKTADSPSANFQPAAGWTGLATERALDKYKFFVFGLTIATTLY